MSAENIPYIMIISSLRLAVHVPGMIFLHLPVKPKAFPLKNHTVKNVLVVLLQALAIAPTIDGFVKLPRR